MVLALRDPNGKTVAEQTVESDEWGTFSATFALPVKGLSGRYAVRTGNNSVGFTVEEYKRPTFEVRLDEITARYQAGDTLCLAGTAMGYNGVPLRLARVTAVSVVGSWFYRVDRGGSTRFIPVKMDASRCVFRCVRPGGVDQGMVPDSSWMCRSWGRPVRHRRLKRPSL